MAPTFANPLVQQIKAIKEKLTVQTYLSIFGNSHQERSQATSEASALNVQLDDTLAEVYALTDRMRQVMHGRYPGNSLAAANQLVEALESYQPQHQAMQAGSQPSDCQSTGYPTRVAST